MGASLAEPFPLCQTPMAVGPNSAPPTALLCAQLGPEVPAWRIASADTRSNRFLWRLPGTQTAAHTPAAPTQS